MMQSSERKAIVERMTEILTSEVGGAVYMDIVTGAHRFEDVRFAVAFDSAARRNAGVALFAKAKMPLLGSLDYSADPDDEEFPQGTFFAYFGDTQA